MDVPLELAVTVAIGLVLVNLASFALCWFDKRAARLGRRRVPERTLIATVLFGGPFGLGLGMRRFRHKTVKKSFRSQFAAAAVVWLAWVGTVLWFVLADPGT